MKPGYNSLKKMVQIMVELLDFNRPCLNICSIFLEDVYTIVRQARVLILKKSKDD